MSPRRSVRARTPGQHQAHDAALVDDRTLAVRREYGEAPPDAVSVSALPFARSCSAAAARCASSPAAGALCAPSTSAGRARRGRAHGLRAVSISTTTSMRSGAAAGGDRGIDRLARIAGQIGWTGIDDRPFDHVAD